MNVAIMPRSDSAGETRSPVSWDLSYMSQIHGGMPVASGPSARVAAGPTVLDRLLRPGRTSARDVVLDVGGLLVFALVLMGAGLGLREP